MKAKHTDGPWKVKNQLKATLSGNGGNCEPTTFYSVEADDYVAGGGVALVHIKAGYSNASLIAAAPDLLDACKLVLESLIEIRAGKLVAGSSLEQQAEILSRAIAKAEGD